MKQLGENKYLKNKRDFSAREFFLYNPLQQKTIYPSRPTYSPKKKYAHLGQPVGTF